MELIIYFALQYCLAFMYNSTMLMAFSTVFVKLLTFYVHISFLVLGSD